MKISILVFCGIATLFLTGIAAYAADVFFVQAATARIVDRPSVSAAVLGEVENGYQFTSSGREGAWVRLKFGKRTGYLPLIVVADHSPLTRKPLRSSLEDGNNNGMRGRSSSPRAVVAGVKGLTYEERERASKGERVDYRALERIEAVQVSAEELSRFMAGGGL